MSVESTITSLTFPAAADLRTKQFYAISIDSSGAAALATAAKNCDGFLQGKPNIGEAASVGVFGQTKAIASGNISKGQLVEVDTGGKIKAVASGTVVGKALEASGADGTVISILMLKSNAVYS